MRTRLLIEDKLTKRRLIVKCNISLRKFPHPYKAALTICNDLDEYTFEEFIEIHRFLNTREETSMGQGLGLEIGDSFWMYSVKSDVSDSFTYFDGLSDERTPYAETIKKLVKAGYLDCLHTYGNFNQYGGFHRGYAEKAIAEMERQEMHVQVWIDHGDMHNFQNVNYLGGTKERSIGNGVTTRIVEYHTDLSKKYGVRFYWPMIVTPVVGQNRKIGWGDILSDRSNRKRLIINRLAYFFLKLIPQHYIEKQAFLSGKIRRLELLFENPLIFSKTLPSGDKVYCFQRYGDWFNNGADSLGVILSERKLNKLIESNGSSIVYVHIGRKAGSCADILPKISIKALKELSFRYQEGEIYVTTTSRLLTYHLVSQNLVWQVVHQDDIFVIDIIHVKDEVDGNFVPTLDQLQGITFYTDKPHKTIIRLAGNDIKEIQINKPDESCKASVSIPRTHLVFPEICRDPEKV